LFPLETHLLPHDVAVLELYREIPSDLDDETSSPCAVTASAFRWRSLICFIALSPSSPVLTETNLLFLTVQDPLADRIYALLTPCHLTPYKVGSGAGGSALSLTLFEGSPPFPRLFVFFVDAAV